MYTIVYKKKAVKELLALPKEIALKIRVIINNLANNPRPRGCKKLIGSINEYRIRTGNYRVIYTISDDVCIIFVIKIAHRKESY